LVDPCMLFQSSKFYDMLSQAIASVPSHNHLLIVAYFNAKIGRDQALYPFNNATNKNGE